MSRVLRVASQVQFANGEVLAESYQFAANEVIRRNFDDIADATTDLDIFPGNLTSASWVYLLADQAITIKINGADTDYTLTAGRPLILPIAVTALTVSNATGSTANLELIVAGT